MINLGNLENFGNFGMMLAVVRKWHQDKLVVAFLLQRKDFDTNME
jgi:hypothetical protein